MDFMKLIGLKVDLVDKYLIASAWDKETQALYVGEYFNDGVRQTTRISLKKDETTLALLKALGYPQEVLDDLI